MWESPIPDQNIYFRTVRLARLCVEICLVCRHQAKEVERVRCQCVYVPTLAYTCTFQCLRSCLDRSRAEGLAIRFLSECVFTSPADRRSSFIPVTSQPLFMSALGGLCEEAAAFSSGSVALTQRPSYLMVMERACDSFYA